MHSGVDRQAYEQADPGAAGRDLVLELLDLYVASMTRHVAFHEAHEMPEFAETSRYRLNVAMATRTRVQAGGLL